ncbi:MAG: hypothetical protein GXY77_03290 [Fibrobacter sp.]|nr:hypothetical protein [Fibrobacter sp.]
MFDNDNEEIAPEKVSDLINKILETKDPATVGLRKIIRRKNEEKDDFFVHKPQITEFDFDGKKKKNLSEDELRILELEKTVADLKIQLQKNTQKAQNAVQNAFVKGKTQGVAQGIEKGKAETTEIYEKKIDEIQLRIGNVLKKVEEEKQAVFRDSEHLLLQLCMEMVKKIIATELSINKDVILSVLKKALNSIAEKDNLIIRISPDDMDAVSGRKDFWVPVSDNLKNITIEPDERISCGGCIIESNSGTTDARLGVQCDELSELVLKAWENVNASIPQSNTKEITPVDLKNQMK